jgi:hypothetical protein
LDRRRVLGCGFGTVVLAGLSGVFCCGVRLRVGRRLCFFGFGLGQAVWVLWYFGILVFWCFGVLVFWCFGVLVTFVAVLRVRRPAGSPIGLGSIQVRIG